MTNDLKTPVPLPEVAEFQRLAPARAKHGTKEQT
ncbi:hypothetical protein EV652_1163 [Kribbella steppae]|uniref:Uncharacterized protein n=1 Tax=Kribbella steppae TaxID=2512223 RepID=A0A4R2H0H4_9ACTN|nr:hypothetical protein EV652_1163 [Kribbella steppae]